MDDLIVIILTLIVAAAGALGQLKKKKQVPPAEGEESKTPESLWDLLQGEPDYQHPVEVQDFKKEKHDEYTEPLLKADNREVNESKYKYIAQNEGQVATKVKKPMAANRKKLKPGVIKDFSLRKAVIYSEILNKKYS